MDRGENNDSGESNRRRRSGERSRGSRGHARVCYEALSRGPGFAISLQYIIQARLRNDGVRAITWATVSQIRGKWNARLEEGGHGDLIGGVQDGGKGAAALPGLAGEVERGEIAPARGFEVQPRDLREIERAQVIGTRSGHVTAYWMGKHMSEWESCASTEPSTNSTIEWTMLCGWTTTSTRAISTSKSQRASIISSPLLNSVAESMVIFSPMFQVGCRSACSRVTVPVPRQAVSGMGRRWPSG